MPSTPLTNASHWAQGNSWSSTGFHRQCKGFFIGNVSSSTSFLPNMQFACCKILQDTLGDNFDIFAANGEATASVLLWKTRSRPIGMNVCPVAQLNFYSTAFDPPAWTLVVFWKENLGRQPQLITPENEGGDNTNYPSAPTSTFLDDPEVPCCPQGTQPPAPPEPQEPPGQPGQPGIPPGWPTAPSRACGGMSGNKKYIAWSIASATFTARASTYSNTDEWWRRWWWPATAQREAKATI